MKIAISFKDLGGFWVREIASEEDSVASARRLARVAGRKSRWPVSADRIQGLSPCHCAHVSWLSLAHSDPASHASDGEPFVSSSKRCFHRDCHSSVRSSNSPRLRSVSSQRCQRLRATAGQRGNGQKANSEAHGGFVWLGDWLVILFTTFKSASE